MLYFLLFGFFITNLKGQTEWGTESNGLRCRISIKNPKNSYKIGDTLSFIVEFNNVSDSAIILYDFLDPPISWAPASYLRGIILGFNCEPIPYHLLVGSIDKVVLINPNEIYTFIQYHNRSTLFKVTSNLIQMNYDTKIVEKRSNNDCWKGKLKSNLIKIEVEE